ncbi:CLUMA_CG012265, isoform A [Clunio marinus]|uniref:CLUMA_CG012265, isoform A n=1 Tax=Clunio marinus TaxID=568069 RepID=A0A1J1IFU8_9DIPT|nr:CLUMA_CG012265, isoform A [Clunio marinus]
MQTKLVNPKPASLSAFFVFSSQTKIRTIFCVFWSLKAQPPSPCDSRKLRRLSIFVLLVMDDLSMFSHMTWDNGQLFNEADRFDHALDNGKTFLWEILNKLFKD